MRRGVFSSELLICGGGVRSILLLPLVSRFLETTNVCIWHMFVCTSVVITVWGVCVCCVTVVVECWSRMQEATIWKRHAPEPVS